MGLDIVDYNGLTQFEQAFQRPIRETGLIS